MISPPSLLTGAKKDDRCGEGRRSGDSKAKAVARQSLGSVLVRRHNHGVVVRVQACCREVDSSRVRNKKSHVIPMRSSPPSYLLGGVYIPRAVLSDGVVPFHLQM